MDLDAASPCALDHDLGDVSCSPSVDSPTPVPQDRVPESAGGACGDACGEKAADASESQVLSPKMDPPCDSDPELGDWSCSPLCASPPHVPDDLVLESPDRQRGDENGDNVAVDRDTEEQVFWDELEQESAKYDEEKQRTKEVHLLFELVAKLLEREVAVREAMAQHTLGDASVFTPPRKKKASFSKSVLGRHSAERLWWLRSL